MCELALSTKNSEVVSRFSISAEERLVNLARLLDSKAVESDDRVAKEEIRLAGRTIPKSAESISELVAV